MKFELTKFGYMPIRKRSNELAKRLMEEGEKMNRKEFKKLVKKGVFKDTEEDYTRFLVCKYCNYNNHDTNCCTILPESEYKCPLSNQESNEEV